MQWKGQHTPMPMVHTLPWSQQVTRQQACVMQQALKHETSTECGISIVLYSNRQFQLACLYAALALALAVVVIKH